MEQNQPLFIVGTERSGSNLLRLILNTHSRIAIPHPPHIMKEMFRLEPYYGDLSDDRSFGRLTRDVIRLVEAHSYPWKIPLSADRAVAQAPSRSLLGVCAALYDQYREAEGKARWGCKSTFMIRHTAQILEQSPGAKFILLVRDPRDVVLSARRSVFNHYHPYYTAGLWAQEQRQGMDLKARAPNNTMVLRYEDLLDEPESRIRDVCVFLNEAFEEGMLNYFETPEAKLSGRLSEDWKNTAAPIMKGNHGKFRGVMAPGEIALIEAVAGPEMRAFGYDILTAEAELEAMRARGYRRWTYFVDESLTKARVEVTHLFKDKNALQRLQKSLFLGGLSLRLRLGL